MKAAFVKGCLFCVYKLWINFTWIEKSLRAVSSIFVPDLSNQMLKKSGYILALSLAAFSCKTSRVATTTGSSQAPADRDTVSAPVAPPAPVVYITSQGDTLTQLGEEVSLEVFKVVPDTLTVIGVGDMMLGTKYPTEDYLPPADGSLLLSDVADILKAADITFGNYEGVILDEEGKPKECNNPKLCYLFKTPEHYASHLKDAGFDVMSLANNHAGDFGEEGRRSSVSTLTGLGIAVAGTQSTPYAIFEAKKTKIGFAAFAPNSGTVSIHDYARAKQIIQHLDSVCQIVIVSFHAGGEGPDYQHVTRKREFFVGEDRGNVYEFARLAIDAGADVVFGHGPHVTRAVDLYNGKFIAYSMGNFCTYRRFNLKGPNGIAPIVKLWVNANGDFLQGQIVSTHQPGSGGPLLDENKKVLYKIRELTLQDFPETALEILDDGLITFKINN